MAKLICTSRYIKNSQSRNAGNLIKYMDTRERVEKLSDLLFRGDHSYEE